MARSHRAMDTIYISSALLEKDPIIAAAYAGAGLVVVLEQTLDQQTQPAAGQIVGISTPDGLHMEREVHSVQVNRGVISLFFLGGSRGDVPLGSILVW